MRITLSLLMCFIVGVCIGQVTLLPKQMASAPKGVVYKNEWSVDLRLQTNGFALAFNTGKIKTYYNTNYYHFEIGRLKDPRERSQNKNISVINPPITSKSFIFGKRNSVYVLRGGIGRKVYWSEKAQKKGIAVGYHYEIGPSIAILKPYFLTLIYSEDGDRFSLREEKYTEENKDKFVTYDDILGGAGFFKGIGESSFVPGLQGKIGLHFALGAFDQKVKAVECGLMFDLYARKIPILVETEEVGNKPYFVNLYLNLQFGRRSLK